MDATPSSPGRAVSAPALVAWLLVLAGLVALPRFLDSPYALHMMVLLFLSIIMGEAWNVLGGYTGQYSVGHAAYFGAGAYTTMMLMQFKQVPPWYGVFAGIAVALLLALVIGSITFRLRGPYFVLASIAMAEILRLIVLNWKDATNGAEGILATEVPPLKVGSYLVTDFSTKVPFYYGGLALAVAVILVNWAVQGSKLGYYFQAIREDQDAAHSLGIHLSLYKNVALAISAVFTAWAGAYYAVYVGFIDPAAALGIDVSVQIVLICIIGGIGTILGPMVGSLVLVPLSEALRSNLIAEGLFRIGLVSESSPTGQFLRENLAHAHALIYGVLVVVVILFMPDGVLGFVRHALARRRAA
ncbi:branched-chain amino acid ABC transporter permease [Anaeromyxobacter paludicola]|uniref:Branched-chain amino acid ABC transporter permease n=1 Tax=Anaeromyxobacter paludicola TaxID=2918171 RepID=A0ABM7X5X3_9BACT|nr:branched-chain amino acid ABC transporter permease [Anaeromyxobacter paludicola]BDG07214.1 branched-chain amino acid ABC transporter permease [Anaeromyxobacter paludicola]